MPDDLTPNPPAAPEPLQGDAEPVEDGSAAPKEPKASTGFDTFIDNGTDAQADAVLEAELAGVDDLPEKTTILDEMQGILAELHITRRQVVMLGAFAVSIVVLIIISFVFLLGFLGDDVDTVERPDPEPIVIESTTEVVEPEADGPSLFSRIFGLDDDNAEDVELPEGELGETSVDEISAIGAEESLPIGDATTELAEVDAEPVGFVIDLLATIDSFGIEPDAEDKISYYVRTFRLVRNTFNTDLFALLDNAVDRQTAYDEYLASFKGQNAQALLAFEELRQEIERLDATFSRVEQVKEQAEARYLEASQALQSEDLPELLASFETLAEKSVVVRAELKAREQIFARYEQGLPLIAEKIRAVEANQDAFVRGVKVVEFPRIDLDLVVEP